jgi:ABC-type phosphate/phosphonate transport system substrate-binding protein
MSDLHVIADGFQDVAGSGSAVFPVFKNSPVHSIADLKGKMVATTNAQSRHTLTAVASNEAPPHTRAASGR